MSLLSTVNRFYSECFCCELICLLPHPEVGERGVEVLRVELQSDESDVTGDSGHHDLHRLILGDAHILEHPRQENDPVCYREGQVRIVLNRQSGEKQQKDHTRSYFQMFYCC